MQTELGQMADGAGSNLVSCMKIFWLGLCGIGPAQSSSVPMGEGSSGSVGLDLTCARVYLSIETCLPGRESSGKTQEETFEWRGLTKSAFKQQAKSSYSIFWTGGTKDSNFLLVMHTAWTKGLNTEHYTNTSLGSPDKQLNCYK